MKKIFILGLLSVMLVPLGSAQAAWTKANTELIEFNKKLKGKILDYTDNHGHDNRIWSRSLGQRRDLYVYLPPNFDPHKRYPLAIFLHGLGQDEQVMFDLAPLFDKSMYVGDLPPMIVAVPDGSVRGIPESKQPGTFFLNSNLGDFEDYVLDDVWDFLTLYFPIRPEREAHVLAGYSMGGYAAFSIGLRHRYCFSTVIGIHPPLNMRWMDDCGNYFAKFNPYHWGWRTNFDHPGEVIGRFGLTPVRVGQLTKPLFVSADEAIVEVSRNNPIELVERTCLRNGELQMYVGYGAYDEFNVTAQVESFLYLCKFKQIYVGVGYDADGHHDMRTAYRLWPGIVTWLAPRVTTRDIPVQTQVCERPNVAKKVAPPVERTAEIRVQPRPQPETSYWTPEHLSPGQSTTGGTNVAEAGPTIPTPTSRTSQIPPPNRADLGPAGQGIRYGLYDAPSVPSAPETK
jgi:S-formylglutathione hydrolase FrmB